MPGENLSARLASLSPAKRALLELKLKQNGVARATTVTIPRRIKRDAAPLSFAQQRLWFLSQLEPESCTYNETAAIRLAGELNVKALRDALNAIVERHEVLRTRYAMADDGNPVQIVGGVQNVELPILDISELQGNQQDAEVQRIALELKARPFDLSKEMPLRLALIRLSAHSHVLLEIKHHIASDGWSSGVFSRELATLYGRLIQNDTTPLPELPIQYADYAIWQREWLQDEALEKQLSYWKEHLRNLSLLELRTDRPRAASQLNRAARKYATLSDTLIERLKALSKQEGSTLFMTALAAFQILLHRYTGQDDIVVGSPIAGRTRAELEGLIGFFVNTLVYKNDLSGDPTFTELLAKVRKRALEAYEHQDLPFEKLVEELNPERSLSHSPLFQVLFAVQNVPRQKVEISGLTATPVEIDSITAKFDLVAAFVERDGQSMLRMEYNADLFNGDTIVRMLGHFRTLLEGVVANPNRRISDLPLLSESERHQILIEWNDTRREFGRDANIIEMFEKQVELTPEATAVVCGTASLTYKELNQRANRLAHYLIGQGVQKETHVAICLERSVESAVGLLAILKAGGVYAPLDPSYPRERIALMLQDMPAPLLVSVQSVAPQLSLLATQSIFLDAAQQHIAREDHHNPLATITPDSPAYVLYTSGSTGKPKGVELRHRALGNLISWQMKNFSKPSAARTLQFASLGFDVSIQEMFATWCSGGSLFLIREELRRDGLGLLQYLEQQSVERIFLPFVALQNLADAAAYANCFPRSLREIITAGEQLQLTETLRSFLNQLDDCCLRNQYGPTESHVVTEFALKPPFANSPDLPPIGRPIANAEIYILDSYLNPVPIGVAGEIYIGGAGLARGYLNQPELTAEKFITHSFDGEAAKRLYRTGDLARYLPDGNIEFLGRIDNQVKIRGFRIEPGEIEAVLNQCAGVRESVVIARADDGGEKRLVAYVVADAQLNSQQLRIRLKEKLPEYMIPNVFVLLDSLPRTASAKIDRRALPVPDRNRPDLTEAYAAPRTPIEELLAKIWQEVLKLEKVGIHDNFFNLGGHSMLAIQVVSRICQLFQMNVPLRCLFENPTVATFAKNTEIASKLTKSTTVIPLQRVFQKDHVPLSFAQQRLWFLDQMEVGNPAFNLKGIFRLTGLLNSEALERSLNEIVRRHDSLRTTFDIFNGNPVQVIASTQTIKLRTIDLEDLPKNERETRARQLAMKDGKSKFDLKKGPLFRTHLMRLSPQDHILGIHMHHIVSDGWSMRVLYRELSALYRAFAAGQPSPLAELPFQYADYAVWQKDWFKGEVMETQLSYWKNQLGDIPPILELPTDHPRPGVQTYRGGRATRVIPAELHTRLKTLGKQESVTLFMVLLAAFQTQLYRYTDQDDVVIGSPIAGRNIRETEEVIGFFLNNLVLRTSLSGNPTFRELLSRVRKVALGAYEHQDFPFEKLLEELRPERDLSRTPLFQVYLNMFSLDDAKLDLQDLTVETLSASEPLSKFDLTLYVKENSAGLRFDLVFNADLFEQSRIDEMLRQLEHLLSQVVDRPDKKIDSYSLVTPDSEKLLPNPSEKLDDGWEGAVHEKLALHAKTHPRRLAVIDRRNQWTYEELNCRSNQLAHYLLDHGIQSGNLIAIRGHRSAPLVCAVLGILKAGAAFLILDPAYPALRLIECLKQANPQGWIDLEAAGRVGGELKNFVDTLSLGCRLELSESLVNTCVRLKDYLTDDPGVSTGPDTLAYVSFTSGSTGQPKGVLGKHGSLSHFLPWQEQTFGLDAADRFTMLSGLAHDPLQRDIFTPLWMGATLCIPDPDFIGTSKLAHWMNDQNVTFSHLTPAMLQLLTESQGPEQCVPTLRYTFFIGDPLTPRDVRRIRRLAPEVICIGSYGTTETQRAVGYFVVQKDSDLETSSHKAAYPLGRGMKDVQLLVLNSDGHLAGIGELGEIYVRSPHLALGYLADDGLTRSRFLPNPFTNAPGDRLYKTGDLGRYLPDGNLEFAGRTDGQVKVRGFRVEPGDVETALSEHLGIKECAVLARADDAEEQRLVAYIVTNTAFHLRSRELRAFLANKLPEYMVPAAFVVLDSLPLTPNGKLDRQALPPPDSEFREAHAGYVAPRTPVEQVLAGIWAEVLRVERVCIHDNFFDLGGHSLMGIRLIDHVCKEFQIELPLRRLFECPTVAGLAESLDADLSRAANDRRANSPWRYLLELKPGQGKQPIFFLPGGVGGDHEFLVYARLTHFVGDKYTFYGLRARSADGTELAHPSVEEMATDYLSEMRELQPEGPYFIVAECIGGIVAYEIARQLQSQGQRVGLLALMDTGCPSTAGYLRYRLRRILTPWQESYYYVGLRHHLKELKRLNWGARLPYFLSKSKALFRDSSQIAANARSPVPVIDDKDSRRLRRVQEGYVDTLRRYRPRPYDGNVIMLVNEKSHHDDLIRGWPRYIKGKIDLKKIPGDHAAYIRRYVRMAGAALKECLDGVGCLPS